MKLHFLFQLNYRYFGFLIRFPSTNVKKLRESLVYPPMSFISELGGSLSLFVGFSFLTVWDYFDVILDKLTQLNRHRN